MWLDYIVTNLNILIVMFSDIRKEGNIWFNYVVKDYRFWKSLH